VNFWRAREEPGLPPCQAATAAVLSWSLTKDKPKPLAETRKSSERDKSTFPEVDDLLAKSSNLPTPAAIFSVPFHTLNY